MNKSHPPAPTHEPLKSLWGKTVQELATLRLPDLTDGEQERHRIFCMLVCALIAHYWNGNKRGREGDYGTWRKRQTDGRYPGGDYLGHNIAAIAVDARGNVMDFDFNHNEIFNSSVEHAESRIVRRIFSLAQLNDGWATRKPEESEPDSYYATQLSQVTIYTSLESCAQCSGIMALGSVKRVVFVQRDPGQSAVGNVLRNLLPRTPTFAPPVPMPADLLGFAAFERLDAAYRDFGAQVASQPFWRSPDGKTADARDSITSFLCTDPAFAIFQGVADDLASFVPAFGDFVPVDENDKPVAAALSNAEVLAHVRRFLGYAKRNGCRGTPHKL